MALRCVLFLTLVCALAFAAGTAAAEPLEDGAELPAIEIVDGHPLRTVLPPDAIAALDLPSTAAASAARFMDDEERVIGVVAGGQARAYPLAELDWHEVVNDELGGRSIAVTW